jgi:hypothetical protein
VTPDLIFAAFIDLSTAVDEQHLFISHRRAAQSESPDGR